MERAAVVFAQTFPMSANGGYCGLGGLLDVCDKLRVLDDYVTRLKLNPRLRFTTGLHCVEDARPQAVEFNDYNIGLYRYHLISQTTFVGESTRKPPKVKLRRTFHATSRAILNSTSNNVLSDLVASSNFMYSTEA